MSNIFSANLRKARERAGYKQAKDFAAALGLSYTTYVAYENQGREPKYDMLCKIAAALHVTTDELLGYEIAPFDFQYYKSRLEGYGYEIKEMDGKVLVFFHNPLSKSKTNNMQFPAEYDSRQKFMESMLMAIGDAHSLGEIAEMQLIYNRLSDNFSIQEESGPRAPEESAGDRKE